MNSYTFNAKARYQEKDQLRDFRFNTYANSIEDAYKDIKRNADNVCCEYFNLRLVMITTISIKEEERILIWKEQEGKIEQKIYNKPLYITYQIRKNKSKRINKKWAKKYGFKKVKNN